MEPAPECLHSRRGIHVSARRAATAACHVFGIGSPETIPALVAALASLNAVNDLFGRSVSAPGLPPVADRKAD